MQLGLINERESPMGHGARRLRLLDDLLPKQRKCRIVWDGTVINNARVIKNELSRY